MYKPNGAFKIDRQTKITASRISDPHLRGEYVRMMIQAQLAYEKKKNSRNFKIEPDGDDV